MSTRKLIRTKLSSISKRLKRESTGAWIIFTREGSRDPIGEDFGLGACTWRSAAILTSDDRLYAVVGSFEQKMVSRFDLYDEVEGYGSEGPVDALRRILDKNRIRVVAIDESEDFGLADGLSSGMKRYLSRHLKGVRKFVSAEDLIIDFRARLFPEEIRKVKRAIRVTEEILEDAQRNVIKPGRKDKDVFEYVQKLTRENDATFSWDEDMNPSICVGTIAPQHSAYDNVSLHEGKMMRIDFGIKLDGYCSDIQRVYFFGRPPREFNEDFQVARSANDAAISRIEPNAKGYEIDEAGRNVVIGEGFPSFMHGLGHTLGRTAHEIGPVLAPRWKNRYGHSMEKQVGTCIVLTIEPTVFSKFGGINLEQDVLVNEDERVSALSIPQEEPIVI
jgi:Xaa-Pro aminopeptidase